MRACKGRAGARRCAALGQRKGRGGRAAPRQGRAPRGCIQSRTPPGAAAAGPCEAWSRPRGPAGKGWATGGRVRAVRRRIDLCRIRRCGLGGAGYRFMFAGGRRDTRARGAKSLRARRGKDLSGPAGARPPTVAAPWGPVEPGLAERRGRCFQRRLAVPAGARAKSAGVTGRACRGGGSQSGAPACAPGHGAERPAWPRRRGAGVAPWTAAGKRAAGPAAAGRCAAARCLYCVLDSRARAALDRRRRGQSSDGARRGRAFVGSPPCSRGLEGGPRWLVGGLRCT
jgi:hypothetical protein